MVAIYLQGEKQSGMWDDLLHRAMRATQGQEATDPFHKSQALSRAPVVDFVNKLLEDAAAAGASDIHLEPGREDSRIRFRIDGELREVQGAIPLRLHAFLVARLKVMAGLDTTERRTPMDGRIQYRYADEERVLDVRVATMPMLSGEKAVLRLLDGEHGLRSLERLDFSPENAVRFRKLIHATGGLLLICGPTNSGKTTTLYAAMHELNDISRNITTLEDPPEIHLPGINQMQVNEKTGLTFAKGLRAILRADPDLIMVGEIRDGETAEIAVRAALAGRLIFSTIHTGHAVGAIPRLLDMGVPPYLLASALLGTVAQRLVRRRCKDGEGFRGRLALHEVMVMDDLMRTAIMERRDAAELEKIAAAQGMVSMLEDGREKAAQGLTTLAEVERVLYGGE